MTEPARILVVDDEPAVQSALSRALALERYEVTPAMDGREALERLGAAPCPTLTAWRSAGACARGATEHPC
jgi:CheY-like chemotaxis protein